MAELVRSAAADPGIAVPGFSVRRFAPARICLVGFGPALPPNTATEGEPCRLWLAPDRTLVVCDTPDAPVEGAFVTDVTDGYAVFALAGERLDEVLAMGCTLDPAALTPGRCAHTLFAGVRVLLQPRAGSCRLYVDRSMGEWLLAWLRRSADALAFGT